MKKITPCLWFDNEAEQAAEFYTSIFDNSRILGTTRYGKEGFEIHGRPEGSVMTVRFEINGSEFTALNGGPLFKFNESVSFQVSCETQEELNRYWEKLAEGGDPAAQQCGWLKDRYGLSWQIVPQVLEDLITDKDPVRSDRVMRALLEMKRLDISKLEQAYAGE